jgi:hypothetical protein
MSEQFKLTPPSPSSPGPKQRPEHRWLEWAAQEWQEIHGTPMTVRWPRDLALIRPMLRLHGEDELKARWRAHVRATDEYLARKGWNVPSFSESIDRYLGDRDRVELVRRWNEHQRNRRDPLTGIKR